MSTMYRLLARFARPWLFAVLSVLLVGLFGAVQILQSTLTHLPGIAVPATLPDSQSYYTAGQLVTGR